MSIPIRPQVRALFVVAEASARLMDNRVSAARVILETRARTAALPMTKATRVRTEGRASTRAPAWLPAPAIRVGAAKRAS